MDWREISNENLEFRLVLEARPCTSSLQVCCMVMQGVFVPSALSSEPVIVKKTPQIAALPQPRAFW
jgi:hypothetical protein